MYISLMVH